MAETTSIEWTDHTWSPVWGCTQVSKAETGGGGCDNCYAMTLAHRFGYGWNGEPMREFGDHHWDEPLRWDRRAAAAGTRPRVFPSMCDPFDKDWPPGMRLRFFRLIMDTPHLTWLLLTKRVGNAMRMLDDMRAELWPDPDEELVEANRTLWLWLTDWLSGVPPENVWLGATIVNQMEADRDIPKLLAAIARLRFLSIEPMLGAVDLTGIEWGPPSQRIACNVLSGDCRFTGKAAVLRQFEDPPPPSPVTIDWVISGGESGHRARLSHPDWFRRLRDACAQASVAYLHKQHGEFLPTTITAEQFFKPKPKHEGEQIAAAGGLFETVPRSDECTVMRWIGKKAAGRLLDGVEHNGFPA